jgi:glycosyltransferase involved in cell wall biosynthesis
MGAPAGRFHDFGRHWVAQGHRVSVVTAFPNFPSGVIPEPYRGRKYQHEVMDGIDVYRTYIFASPKLNAFTKGLGYLSFILSSSLFLLLKRLDYDVVISTSPPPIMGLPGLLASRKRRVPLVFDVRDIWPEAIVLSGRIKNRLLIRILESVEMLLYRSSALVSVVTEGKRERLMQRGVPARKLAVLWNGVDLDKFDEESDGPLPADFNGVDPEALWFSYAGVFNPAQGLDVILEAADLLRQRRQELYAKTKIVMVGGGSRLEDLRRRRDQLSLDTVEFVPIQPRAVVYRVLRRSFGILIPLRPRKDDHTVPSKIFESLASERPILLSAAGEVATIVSQSSAGCVVEPGDASQLCDAMISLLEDPEAADRAGKRGRAYVAEHFDRRKTAERFLTELERLTV